MAGGVSEGNGSAISGINVTPLVDVMLVLLVIFMVTAPMIQQGVTVELPTTAGAALPAADDQSALVVSVTRDGELWLNDTEMDLEALTTRLVAINTEKPRSVVYVRADNEARYGAVVGVIAALKAAGIPQLGMITEPPGEPS